MISYNIYEDHLKSLLRFCSDFAAQLSTDMDTPFEAVFFDAYDEFDQLPAGSLIGPAAYSFDIDDHLVTVKAMLCIATENDENTFRLTKAMGKLTQLMLPTKRMKVYSAEDGSQIGQMTILDGVRVLAQGGGGGRAMKYLAFMAASDVTLDLAS